MYSKSIIWMPCPQQMLIWLHEWSYWPVAQQTFLSIYLFSDLLQSRHIVKGSFLRHLFSTWLFIVCKHALFGNVAERLFPSRETTLNQRTGIFQYNCQFSVGFFLMFCRHRKHNIHNIQDSLLHQIPL